MSKPWLSVLMPTYNGEAYLPQALDSVVEQGDKEIECIVVDDGSTDSTLSILDLYSKKIFIKILKQPRSGNWAINTNTALYMAQGDFICMLHQDDLWMEGRLQNIRTMVKQYPKANMILSPAWFIDAKGTRLGLWRCPLPVYPTIIDADIMTEHLLVQNFISISAPVFRRDIAMRCEGLDDNLWHTPDWDLWLKIAAFGNIIYHPRPTSTFRIHPGSMTVTRSNNIQDFRKEYELVLNKHLKLWKKTGRVRSSVCRAARFSIEMNVFLAAILHKKKTDAFRALNNLMTMPFEWRRYLRDSRFAERIFNRIKMLLKKYSS